MANNVRTFKKVIREMEQGETIYIDAISCTLSMIDYLRVCIKNQILRVDTEELSRVINPNARINYILGNSIAPQMVYIKC